MRAEREVESPSDASVAEPEVGASKAEVDAYIADVKSEVDTVAQGRAQVAAEALAKGAAEQAAKAEAAKAAKAKAATVATSLVAKPSMFAQLTNQLKAEVEGLVAKVNDEVEAFSKDRVTIPGAVDSPVAAEGSAAPVSMSMGLSKAEVDTYVAQVKIEVDAVAKARPVAAEAVAAEAGAPASVGLSKAEVDAYIAMIKTEVDAVAKARPVAPVAMEVKVADTPAAAAESHAELISTAAATSSMRSKGDDGDVAAVTPPTPTPPPPSTVPSPVPATLNQQMSPAILNRKPTVEKLLALIKPTGEDYPSALVLVYEVYTRFIWGVDGVYMGCI